MIRSAHVEARMTEYVKAWQCIGCGKIEAPQPCIGVCQDRKVQFVYAAEHEGALAYARIVEQKADVLRALVRQLALTNPRDGEWEKCYLAMQMRARRVLATLTVAKASPRASEEK
jgi:hypothetical protein